MLKIRAVRYSQPHDVIILSIDLNINGGYSYNMSVTARYCRVTQELQLLKVGDEKILCTGLANAIEYITINGSYRIALKFEKILLDLES